jgi:biopolymer transport protein ExbB/TolQ
MVKLFSFCVFIFYSLTYIVIAIALVLLKTFTREIPKVWKLYMQTDWLAPARERRQARRRQKRQAEIAKTTGMSEEKQRELTEKIQEALTQATQNQEKKAKAKQKVDWNELAIQYNDRWGNA